VEWEMRYMGPKNGKKGLNSKNKKKNNNEKILIKKNGKLIEIEDRRNKAGRRKDDEV
jgi:hypothetical protein